MEKPILYLCTGHTEIRHERAGNLVTLVERYRPGEYITQRQYFDLPDRVKPNFVKI